MAQPQFGAGTNASSPGVASAVAGGRAPSSSSSVNTPAQQSGAQSSNQQPQHATATSGAIDASQHKRVYQACIPCRRRKVRCDLGSVDNPHDPPCVRCRRESKECFFSATRRKRKTDDDDEGSDVDDYTVRNGRKRVNAGASPPPRIDRRFYSDVPLTPGGSHGRSQPLRRPDESLRPRTGRDSELDGDGDANQTLENLEAQAAMRRGVYTPHDALDLLYKAATDRSVVESAGKMPTRADLISPAAGNMREDSITSATPGANQPTPQDASRDRRRPGSMSNKADTGFQHQAQQQSQHRQVPPPPQYQHSHNGIPQAQQTVDSGMAQQAALGRQPGYIEALRAWSRFRFVRAGWFTAQEAIEYID